MMISCNGEKNHAEIPNSQWKIYKDIKVAENLITSGGEQFLCIVQVPLPNHGKLDDQDRS